jgi:hypothetical protein
MRPDSTAIKKTVYWISFYSIVCKNNLHSLQFHYIVVKKEILIWFIEFNCLQENVHSVRFDSTVLNNLFIQFNSIQAFSKQIFIWSYSIQSCSKYVHAIRFDSIVPKITFIRFNSIQCLQKNVDSIQFGSIVFKKMFIWLYWI